MNRRENNQCLKCGNPLVRIDKDNPFHLVCSQCEEKLKEMWWMHRKKEGKPYKVVNELRFDVLGKPMNFREARKALNEL